jgi:hypothetical protein
VLDLRLGESTRKQRVTAVASDPAGEALIEMVARGSNGARTAVATLSVSHLAVDQAARKPSGWLEG